MDPQTRVPFPKWSKKILTVLCIGQIFKAELVVDKYALLPSFWHVTKLEYKKKIVGVVDRHNGFSPECILGELKEACHILLLQMESPILL
jgi:hypothetical protein